MEQAQAQTQEVGELVAALCRFHQEIRPVPRNREGLTKGRHDYRYADLEAVCEASRGALARNGLVVVQTTRAEPRAEGVTTLLVTTLYHTSGQWLRGECPLWWDLEFPQDVGTKLTYVRRYTYCAILQLVSEDDHDARGQEPGRGARPAQAQAPRREERPAAGAGRWPQKFREAAAQVRAGIGRIIVDKKIGRGELAALAVDEGRAATFVAAWIQKENAEAIRAPAQVTPQWARQQLEWMLGNPPWEEWVSAGLREYATMMLARAREAVERADFDQTGGGGGGDSGRRDSAA